MRFARSRPKGSEERTLPLINVVFLLLIFFMLSGQLAAVDPFQTEPPQSASEGQTPPRQFVVHLGADGRLALDGEIMDEITLGRVLAQHEGPTKIRLKADGRVDAVRTVVVMEVLRNAGVEKVDLLTVPERP
ncbi:MAG: biopolymer transporter ExbD [Rhodospirillales bacterium]|nr:biopolymer transporter ExbD [Rhodospirillales bacterium]